MLFRSRDTYSGRAELPDAAKIELHNSSVGSFNDRTRKLVGSANSEIAHVGEEVNAGMNEITNRENLQIQDIEGKIQRAMESDQLLAGDPEIIGSTFADPHCTLRMQCNPQRAPLTTGLLLLCPPVLTTTASRLMSTRVRSNAFCN